MPGPLTGASQPLTDEAFQDILEHLMVESVMGLHARLRSYLPVSAYLYYPDSHRPDGMLQGRFLRLPACYPALLTWAQQRTVLDHLGLNVPDPEQVQPFLDAFERPPELEDWTDALHGIVRVAEVHMPALARQRISRDALRTWLNHLDRTGSLRGSPNAEALFRKILSHP